MLRPGAVVDSDGLTLSLSLEEGALGGGRLVLGAPGEGVDDEDVDGEGEFRGDGTGDGVVAGTVVLLLSGRSVATAAPVPEKTRQAPTAIATIRRLRTRSPRSVMYDGGAERARD
ncbi:hypothetical protein OG298_20325 [Streptomyces sp. NBC_01005]|uniref:hypothetical protein n=1 Tax=unclassified Streptomyces TaxID=2593676 RepID=UPI003863C898|nr:hypothetical protein OG298_20325 [Streptomyces sp. NBC_01005]WTC96036.1 hypothetical protein OH736_20340 [Streptomyces sp. NBC_01650]